MKRAQRELSLTTPIKPRHRVPMDRAVEAAFRLAEVDTGPEADAEFLRAKESFRKTVVECAPSLRRDEISGSIRLSLAQRKAEGLPLGRPTKVEPEAVAKTVERVGNVAMAAEALRVSVRTVFRALRRRKDRAP